MNAKKFIGAWIAGFFVMFLLSGLWYMAIMGDFYRSNGPPGLREQYQMQFIALGYLVLGLLMAYIYPKGYSGGTPVTEGVKFGVLMGLLWILPNGLVMYGVVTGSGKVLVVDAVWHLVEGGIGGIVIGLIYGQTGAASAAEPAPAAESAPEGESTSG